MKKMLNLIAWILALNFLAALGGLVYLNRTGHLDKAKALAVKALLFPPPPIPAPPPPPKVDATTQPAMQLDALLQAASGRPAGDQIAFIQQAFDSRMAELDRRQTELGHQQQQVDIASAKVAADRAALEKEKKDVADREQQDSKLLTDQGFQSTLQLYSAMQPAQVKQVFGTLPDQLVAEYLQQMDTRTAGKIIKEFKAPNEIARIQHIMELVRQPPVTENQ